MTRHGGGGRSARAGAVGGGRATSGGAPDSRHAKEEVNKQIRVFLHEHVFLEPSDFDGRVEQYLHAIHGKKGVAGVEEALRMIAQKKSAQHKVQNWHAYLVVLLRRFTDNLPEELPQQPEFAPAPQPPVATGGGGSGASAESGERRSSGSECSVAGDLTATCDSATSTVSQGDLTTTCDSATSSASITGDEDAASSRSDPATARTSAVEAGARPFPSPVLAPAPSGVALATGVAPGGTSPSGSVEASARQAPSPFLLEQRVEEQCHIGNESFLQMMLANMDQCTRESRPWQQHLVSSVEQACRRVLDIEFKKLILVGSVAMAVETPGSDVDVVCFTTGPVDVVDVLKKIAEVLLKESFKFGGPHHFEAKVLEDARVPILALSWNRRINIDLGLNLQHSANHVRWFSSIGVSHGANNGAAGVPVLTVLLRCVKWWLKQRGIPPAKEGGLPTVAWLLLALHATSGHEVRGEHFEGEYSHLAAVLTMLRAFFQRFAGAPAPAPAEVAGAGEGGGSGGGGLGLAGTLRFVEAEPRSSPALDSRIPTWDLSAKAEADAKVSRFDPSPFDFERRGQPQLVVMDPESGLNLAPPISPATHLLLADEIQTALRLLEKKDEEGDFSVPALFTPPVEFCNILPSWTTEGFGALALVDDPSDSLGTVELVFVSEVHHRARWDAPFLHRADRSSKVRACVLCRDADAGAAGGTFTRGGSVTLSPWNMICCVSLSCSRGDDFLLSPEVVDRLRGMRALFASMRANAP